MASGGGGRPAPWRAARVPPLRFALSAGPWRAVGYLLSGVVAGPLLLVAVLATVVAGIVLAPVGVGLALLGAAPLLVVGIGRWERRRLRLVDADAPPDPHTDVTGSPVRRRVRTRVAEPATWRDMAFLATSGTVGAAASLVALAVVALGLMLLAAPLVVAVVAPDTVMIVPGRPVAGAADAIGFAVLGLVLAVAGLYGCSAAAGGHVLLARLLLAPRDEELRTRLREVRASRMRLADAFESERKRIERDLHDGAQQHLGTVVLTVGLAEHLVDTDPTRARQLLARAGVEARTAQESLRALVRGLAPQVLTDHGLGAALRDVTAGHRPPVEVDADVPRLPSAVESAAYFVALEALTNVARHSGAAAAVVTARIAARRLELTIADDGRGGADPAAGTGLQGLADRVAVLDGTLHVRSPPGGPTEIRAEIPCPA